MKDASPGASALQALASDAHAFLGVSRRRSPPRHPKSTGCHRCDRPPRRRPLRTTGPTELRVPATPREGRRHPADRVLSTAATRGVERITPPAVSRVGLSLTPPTRSPLAGERCFFGPCKRFRAGHPARSIRESERLLCLQVGDSVPGPDDPSTPASSVGVVGGEGCLPRSCLRRPQRLDGFYDREFVARCAANFMSRFMPDPIRTRNKKIGAQSLFLSTELSTALSPYIATKIAAHRESCGRFRRKSRRDVGDVENKTI